MHFGDVQHAHNQIMETETHPECLFLKTDSVQHDVKDMIIADMERMVICFSQIPLQLKWLQPWNRGIHGYFRSHVKGCLSVSLFCSTFHFFSHSSLERNHRATWRFPTATIWLLQMRSAENNLSDINEDRPAIREFWIMNANDITSAVTWLTVRQWNAELV